MKQITASDWSLPYSREKAAFPLVSVTTYSIHVRLLNITGYSHACYRLLTLQATHTFSACYRILTFTCMLQRVSFRRGGRGFAPPENFLADSPVAPPSERNPVTGRLLTCILQAARIHNIHIHVIGYSHACHRLLAQLFTSSQLCYVHT